MVMTDGREDRGAWESREAVREGIRALGVREVRRRGRRRMVTRASIVLVLFGGIGAIALVQIVATPSGVGDEGEVARADSGAGASVVRWVHTDWSIGERTGARSTGVTRWVSNEDLTARIERAGGLEGGG